MDAAVVRYLCLLDREQEVGATLSRVLLCTPYLLIYLASTEREMLCRNKP